MSRDLVVVPTWVTVPEVLPRLRWPRHGLYPVVDAAGAPVGVLDAASAASSSCVAGEAALIRTMPMLAPDDPAPRGGSAASDVPFSLVVEEGRLIGLITRGSVLRYDRARSLL